MNKKYTMNIGIIFFLLSAAFLINLIRGAGEVKETSSDGRVCYIAVIIDDFGGGAEGTDEFLSLPIKFTGAVMPNLSESKRDAALLKEGGNDVIVHLPMEAKRGKRSWLGERAVLTDMTDDEIRAYLGEVFQGGYAVGVNNHMGSKATADERIMNILFEELNKRDMLFIDSMTTPESLGSAKGLEYGVTCFERDVFLDSTNSKAEILKNLDKTKALAKSRGYALCIGHVGAEGGSVTAEAIKEIYKSYESEGIEFITVSRLAQLIASENLWQKIG